MISEDPDDESVDAPRDLVVESSEGLLIAGGARRNNSSRVGSSRLHTDLSWTTVTPWAEQDTRGAVVALQECGSMFDCPTSVTDEIAARNGSKGAQT